MLKRSKETLIAGILGSCLSGTCKTRIVYQTNMNFTTAGAYIDKLIEKGLLLRFDNGQTIYRTTERGREVLRDLKSIQNEIPHLY